MTFEIKNISWIENYAVNGRKTDYLNPAEIITFYAFLVTQENPEANNWFTDETIKEAFKYYKKYSIMDNIPSNVKNNLIILGQGLMNRFNIEDYPEYWI